MQHHAAHELHVEMALPQGPLRRLAHRREGRHEQVVEIAFNDVQESTQYASGVALRFARVKGYRPDKRAEEADTIDTVRQIYEQSLS
jgi:ATP-dependent DNA ligase